MVSHKILLSTVALSLLLTCGCGSVWRRSSIVQDDDLLVVETEMLKEDGKPVDALFSHPALVPSDRLAIFFKNMSYVKPALIGEASLQTVIPPQDAQTLANAVAKGLARCSPAERVRFMITLRHPKWKVFTEERKTRGVAFVQPDNVINVAFDMVDDAFEKDDQTVMVDTDWGDPTRHTLSHVTLNLPAGASLFLDTKGKQRPLWVTISLKDLTQSPAQPTGNGKESGDPKNQGTVKNQTGTPQSPASTKGQENPKPQENLSDHDILTRLKFLDELLKKGSITQEQYEKEKQALFDRY